MKEKTLCPICKKGSDLSNSNPYRPFCSERCRLVDLGQWFEESYSVSEPIISDDNIIDYSNPLQKH